MLHNIHEVLAKAKTKTKKWVTIKNIVSDPSSVSTPHIVSSKSFLKASRAIKKGSVLLLCIIVKSLCRHTHTHTHSHVRSRPDLLKKTKQL